MPIRSPSLRRLLASALFLAALAPALAVILLTFRLVLGDIERRATASMQSVVRSIASETERYLDAPLRMLETLDQYLGEVEAHDTHQVLIDAMRGARPFVDAIVLTDLQGVVVHMSPYDEHRIGSDFSGEPGFSEAVSGDRPVFSRPYISLASGRVTVSVLSRTFDSMASIQLDLRQLSEFLAPLRLDPHDRIGILDDRGRFVAHSDPIYVLEQRQETHSLGTAESPGRFEADNREWLALQRPIAKPAWRVVYYRDYEASLSVFSRLIASLSLIGLIALLGALAGAMFLRKIILTPFADITAKTRAIASGEYSRRIIGDYPEEFAAFASAFNEMASSVERRDRELQRSEARYRAFFKGMGIPAVLIETSSGIIRDANPSACRYYGYDHEALQGMPLWKINIQSKDEVLGHVREAAAGKNILEARHRLASGELRDVLVSVAPVEFEGAMHNFALVFDVTERRLAEERTAAALREKTVLIKEIHHRVKNNLQIIASLLHLQSGAVRDPEDAELFRASQDRIRSIAIVHELLYRTESLSSISMSEYATQLVEYLHSSWPMDEVDVLIEADQFSLTIERALPCGLILNELVTNAIKYAVPRSRGKRIVVRLRVEEDGAIALEVEDDGPGLPEGADPAHTGSLGFNLVTSLASQLGGDLAWLRGSGPADRPGLRVRLRFSADLEPQRSA